MPLLVYASAHLLLFEALESSFKMVQAQSSAILPFYSPKSRRWTLLGESCKSLLDYEEDNLAYCDTSFQK